MEEKAQAALITEARGASNLPEQDWDAGSGGSQGTSRDQRLRRRKVGEVCSALILPGVAVCVDI